MKGEAVVRVVQHGLYDVYRQDEAGRLVFVKSYSYLARVRDFVRQEAKRGRTVLVRRMVVVNPEWYQYAEHSASGLGYCEKQWLDERVVGGER